MEPNQKSQTELEYTLQHFNYNPNEFAEIFYEDAMALLTSALETLSNLIKNKSNPKADEIDKAFSVITNKYENKWDKTLSKLCIYLHSFFQIPKHVLLPEDWPWEHLLVQTANHQLDRCNQELQAKKEKYQMLLYKKAVLRGVVDDMRAVVIKQEQAINQQSDDDSILSTISYQLEILSKKERRLPLMTAEFCSQWIDDQGKLQEPREPLSSLKTSDGAQPEADLESYLEKRRSGAIKH